MKCSTAAFLRQRNPPARCKTNVEQRPLMCLDRSILGCNGKGTHREIPKPAQVNSIRQARRRLMRWRLWASYFLLPFHRGAFCWRCPICLECLYHTEHSVFHVTHSFSWHLLKTTKSSEAYPSCPPAPWSRASCLHSRYRTAVNALGAFQGTTPS